MSKKMNCAACGESFDVDSHKGGKNFDFGLVYICGKKCMGVFLLDRQSKQKQFKVGDYTLEICLHNRYWISHKQGKEIEVSVKVLEKLVGVIYEGFKND